MAISPMGTAGGAACCPRPASRDGGRREDHRRGGGAGSAGALVSDARRPPLSLVTCEEYFDFDRTTVFGAATPGSRRRRADCCDLHGADATGLRWPIAERPPAPCFFIDGRDRACDGGGDGELQGRRSIGGARVARPESLRTKVRTGRRMLGLWRQSAVVFVSRFMVTAATRNGLAIGMLGPLLGSDRAPYRRLGVDTLRRTGEAGFRAQPGRRRALSAGGADGRAVRLRANAVVVRRAVASLVFSVGCRGDAELRAAGLSHGRADDLHMLDIQCASHSWIWRDPARQRAPPCRYTASFPRGRLSIGRMLRATT